MVSGKKGFRPDSSCTFGRDRYSSSVIRTRPRRRRRRLRLRPFLKRFLKKRGGDGRGGGPTFLYFILFYFIFSLFLSSPLLSLSLLTVNGGDSR